MILTAEQSTCCSRFQAARASDLGAGEGQGSRSGCRGVLEVFLLAAGLVLAAPGCGAALPIHAADPFLIPGCPGPPIRALIQVRLAALSDPDSAADLDPAVWRFWHGEGWLFGAPGVPWRG